MSLGFAHYWPLLFMLAVPLVWWVRGRTATALAPRHLRLSAFVRSAVIVLLALAIMRPVWNRSGAWTSVVYVLDVSRSVSPAFVDSAIRWMAQASEEGSPQHARYVAFATEPIVVEVPEEIRSLSVSTGEPGASSAQVTQIVQSSTNLEKALRRALQNFAPHTLKRLVLLTDGNETVGDLSAALRLAKEQGVRIFAVPAPVRAARDSWIEAIDVPEEVRAEEPVEVGVQVFSRVINETPLELRCSGEVIAQRGVELKPGPNDSTFEVRFPNQGLVTLRASLGVDGTTFPENDHYSKSVWVSGPARVLYVEGHAASAHYLARALAAAGIDVDTVSPRALSAKSGILTDYDAVILSDVPPQSLSDELMSSLEAYVRDEGGGLVFAGGESSYGKDGYSGSPIEEVLPIWFRVQEKRKDLALVIILDKSYSMSGDKMELAKEATLAALALLQDTHRFGLVTFNWDPYVTVPLQLAENRSEIRDEIRRVQASAQTNIFPALRSSLRQLTGSDAKVKHIILLSDGKTYPDDYQGLVARMVEADITISTVAVGEEADRDLLAQIAEWGKGRTYYLEDAARVPQIFIEETQIAVQATLVEEPFQPVLSRPIEALMEIDFSTAPPLRGYVSTQPKDTAEVILESDSGAPVLARWQYGLGKTAAFTSDVKNRWGVEWLSWPSYGKFWSQLVRETLRTPPPPELEFHVRREGEEALISLTAVNDEGHYVDELDPEVEIIYPKGEHESVSLPQVGPGAYQARVPLAAWSDSAYIFNMKAPSTEASRALHYEYPDEYRFYPPRVELLRAVSEETGGKMNPDVEEIFADYGETVSRPVELWPLLAVLALIGYLLDIAIRRAPWIWERLESSASSSSS